MGFCPRPLPTSNKVEKRFRLCALLLNGALYAVTMGVFGYKGFEMVRDWKDPPTETKELTGWGPMPWLTICMDFGSGQNISMTTAMVVQGFQSHSPKNQLAKLCTRGKVHYNNVTQGKPRKGTSLPSACHEIDLRGYIPEFGEQVNVNNLAIGGVIDEPAGSQVPKFISVTASSEPLNDLHSFDPLLFANPERLERDHPTGNSSYGPLKRITVPVFELAKEYLPVENSFQWLTASKQRERYTVRNMGSWKSCIPPDILPPLPPPFPAGLSVFGFGLFISKPTVTSIAVRGLGPRLFELMGLLGGMLYGGFLVFYCVWTRKPGSTPPEPEELTLRYVGTRCANEELPLRDMRVRLI